MSDHDESVSPLFNKMDALMARHRGGGSRADDDAVPVLTEVAEDQTLDLDVLDIPVLTVEAAPEPSTLMFDPREFLTQQAPAPVPEALTATEPTPPQPEFLDLPLLDLDSLLQVPTPFGVAAHEAARAQAPVADLTDAGDAPAWAPAAPQSKTPIEPPAVLVDEAAFNRATDAPAADPGALQWEDPASLALSQSLEYQSEAAAIETLQAVRIEPELSDDDLPVLTAEVATDDGADWATLSPWWDDAAASETITLETWADSASQGFVADEVTAPAPLAEPALAANELASVAETPAEPVFTVEFTHVGESRLEVDLDQVSQANRDADAALAETVADTPDAQFDMAVPDVTATDASADSGAVPADQVSVAAEALPVEPVWQVDVVHVANPPIAPGEVAALVTATEAPEQLAALATEVTAAPQLDANAIAEMTAGVAAHLAVDISTEVERLTRQHFAQMMQSLYGEALVALVEKVSVELEARLAPRIDELVRTELRQRGLLKD
ncbi:hypothetical protein JCM19000A_18670 [Silvimonas sp. JCM 19000]